VTNDELGKAIEALLGAHPKIDVSPAGHNKHAKRYLASNGSQIGWQDELKTRHNIYVERDRVNLARLADIEHRVYEARDFAVTKPNHDLFHADAFSSQSDIVGFTVTDLWQAARIIAEVTA
jgi:hypothetical protein